MSEQYHAQIHTDTLRLRFLLTNTCNQNCKHCLNEYMDKPNGKVEYINKTVFQNCVDAYIETLDKISMPKKVYLSGGEPTLHPGFCELVDYVALYKDVDLILCSNGNNWGYYIDHNVYDAIDHLHFSMGFLSGHKVISQFEQMWKELAHWINFHTKKDLVFSIVTTDDPELESVIIDMMEFQRKTKNGFTLKLFGDLRLLSDHAINKRYSSFIDAYPSLVNRGPVQHPLNRKKGCEYCMKICPTLKALWVRPDNTCSPCPQTNECNWNKILGTDTYQIDNALKFHF